MAEELNPYRTTLLCLISSDFFLSQNSTTNFLLWLDVFANHSRGTQPPVQIKQPTNIYFSLNRPLLICAYLTHCHRTIAVFDSSKGQQEATSGELTLTQ